MVTILSSAVRRKGVRILAVFYLLGALDKLFNLFITQFLYL